MNTASEANIPMTEGLPGWQRLTGGWSLEGAPGQANLVHRPHGDPFNLILAPGGPLADVDATVAFEPVSGREDASAGIVFRYDSGRYYVIRANALEDNFRLYTYDRTRRQVATVHVQPPALGQWHTLRVVAKGDHIQGYLNSKLLLDHHDGSFGMGRIGLWTKADSTTAFRDLSVRAPQ